MMPLTDEDLLNPEKEDELDLSAIVPSSPPAAEPVASQEDPGLARLSELIAARGPQSQGPGAAEREFTASNQPQQAGWKTTLGAIGAALAESGGSHGAIERFHANQQAARQAYESGLERARSIDLGNRPVDRATAELAYRTGMTPEAASQLTVGSSGLKLLSSGLGFLGTRQQAMADKAEKEALDRDFKREMQEDRQTQQVDMEKLRQQGRKDYKAMGKGGKGGGKGSPALTPEQSAEMLIQYLSAQSNATEDQVRAYKAGNLDGIPKDKIAAIRRHDLTFAATSKGKQDALLADMQKREAGNEDRVDLKQRDPKLRNEYRTAIDDQYATIAAARSAWKNMSPEGKRAIATMGGSGWLSNTIRDLSMSESDKRGVAALQRLANALIKKQSGAAVSDQEWDRIAREMGFATRDFDMLKSPESVQQWLDSAAAAARRSKQGVIKDLGNLWGPDGGE